MNKGKQLRYTPPSKGFSWSLIAVVFLFILVAIYALPNLYPHAPAIQLTMPQADAQWSEKQINEIDSILKSVITAKYFIKQHQRNLIVRLSNAHDQLLAFETLNAKLNTDFMQYVIAFHQVSTTPAWLSFIGAQSVKYGLDLSGGVHFLLEVDLDRAIADRLNKQSTFNMTHSVKKALRDIGVKAQDREVTLENAQTIQILILNYKDCGELKVQLEEKFRDFNFSAATLHKGSKCAFKMSFNKNKIREIEDYAIAQNIHSLKNRVNELGVSEPLIQRLGRNRIVVDLPGIQDSAEAKRIIGKVANLEFRLLANENTPSYKTESFDYEEQKVFLKKDIITQGDNVINARLGYDPETNLPQVNVTLDKRGGDKMHKATQANLQKQMAIVFKENKTHLKKEGGSVEKIRVNIERVISVATIQSTFAENFRITGLTLGEASDLALLLRSGALAAPMYIVEERKIGASLGEENINSGFMSISFGFFLVLLAMLLIYRFLGAIANLALIFNILLIITIMSFMGAALTLPGMAGILLTIGISVDANVLIFSRIREELKKQVRFYQAIQQGFDRAFTTILDANITTLFVAVILYLLSSGAMQGFAVTLGIGIVTSLFTMILFTKILLTNHYIQKIVQRFEHSTA